MEDLQQRFAAHWKKQQFISGDRPVLLALSGGIDSMVLAHLLLGANIPFAAVHCNFLLRGKESEEDAAFVQIWCDDRGVDCHIERFDTNEISERRRESIQVTARNLRYEWFEALRKQHGYAAILTAHHADDVAETMLINLCRGTGISGLHGIPERNGSIIRPLLFSTREEISAFAEQQNIQWREDASNAKTDYLRNALRHEVLPKLEALLPGTSSRMAATATRIGEAEVVYRASIKKHLARLLQQRGQDWYIPIRLLIKSEVLNTIAYEVFTPFDFSPVQIPQVLRLMKSESGRTISSPTHRVIRHREFLVVTTNAATASDLVLIDEVPIAIATEEGSFSFSWEGPTENISDESTIALLHGDDLTLPLVLRTRREGDYFYPVGMGGKKKKLKRFLIDTKTPVHEKERVRILEWDKKILWIAGKRIDERFKVRHSTKRILKVIFQPASRLQPQVSHP